MNNVSKTVLALIASFFAKENKASTLNESSINSRILNVRNSIINHENSKGEQESIFTYYATKYNLKSNEKENFSDSWRTWHNNPNWLTWDNWNTWNTWNNWNTWHTWDNWHTWHNWSNF